jgi:Flp pilus assembly protein TadB
MVTHGVVPETPILTKQTYASPMSYVGSTRRVLVWARHDRATWAEIAAWTAAVLGLLLIWTLLATWYVLIFVVFGIFVFPYRLIRRSQRKSAHVQRVQLATMQAMMAGQMKHPEENASQQEHEGNEPPDLRAVQ